MPEYEIFAGTYSNSLFRCNFDANNGVIKIINTIEIENPSYIKINKNILYGVSETSSFNGKNGGALFSVDISVPQKMEILEIKNTHGKHPCHLCIKNKNIFVSNYSEGSLSIFETGKSGGIIQSLQSIHHFGESINKDRQESSHIHFSAVTPDEKFLVLCDLGMDKIFFYPYSQEYGLSTNARIINCPSGSGPRHLVFSKCGCYMYILTELACTVLCYQYHGTEIKLIQEISTLPEGYKGKNTASAVHVSPDGKYLAASNRGHDSIAVFCIKNDGSLLLKKFINTCKEPRDFRYSPCGKWLLSVNQNDDSITVYKIEGEDFVLTGKYMIPKPVCLEFK